MSSSTYSLKGKKKIAVVCNSSNIDFYKYFSSLVKHLDKSQVIFLANTSIVKKIDSSETKILKSSFVKNSFLDVLTILDFFMSFILIVKLRLKNVSLVHFITAHLSNIPQAILAKTLGINIVFTIHDLEPHPDKKSFFIELYNKFVINFLANFIIVHNKKYKEIIGGEKAFFFPLSGFEPEFIARKFQKRILFFGRIEPYKGVTNLFTLANELLKNEMGFEILITGKGNIEYPHDEIPSNIKIINNFISEDDLKIFHESTAFTILPYNSASQSGVIIQSYAYGTPVIAYNVGSLPEYVSHNKTGYIVAHNDFSSIIKFLSNIDEKKYQEMQKEVKKEFEFKYDSNSFARYSINAYNQMLDIRK